MRPLAVLTRGLARGCREKPEMGARRRCRVRPPKDQVCQVSDSKASRTCGARRVVPH